MENINSLVFVWIAAAILISFYGWYFMYCLKNVQVMRSEEIESLYAMIWTGHKSDRLYAWYRTIHYLQARDDAPWMIDQCRLRINELKAEIISDTYVTVNGKAVRQRELL